MSTPTIFVILGITGDLASRKLIPALLTLYSKKLLPQKFAVIGFSRRAFSREEFRELIRSKMNVKPGQFREEEVKHFLDHMSYEQGLFDDPSAYKRLAARLKSIDDRWGQCSNKLFHLSVPPDLYHGVLSQLSASGLAEACDDGSGWTRILIEKPFGDDIETARNLDKLLGKLFKEEQIFRIDHYLAKEAMQNIIAFRYANPVFEPIWDKNSIDKVHIKLIEKAGLEERGAFFDKVGALKDVGQNHILQMLALVAMEEPASLSSGAIRKARAAALSKLKPVSRGALRGNVVRGQYAGYTAEKGIERGSKTETYFRIKAFLSSARWRGVPFYLESGKALYDTKTEIDIYFKEGPRNRVPGESDTIGQNILTFRIQPEEGIKIKFFAKTPGYEWKVEPRPLKFKYSEAAGFGDLPNDYERLIIDAFAGDQTLFPSTAEIMASWKFVTPILKGFESLPLIKYEKGAKEVG